MKLTGASITGFTGVAGTIDVDFAADVVVLHAANGFGKSTLCDAIAWSLTGKHPRDADPRSLYSRTGETQVSVTLRDEVASECVVRRIVTNPGAERAEKIETTVVVEGPDFVYRADEATAWIARTLLPAPLSTSTAASGDALVDGFYLQQESLRDFLTSRSDDERFAALSRMVGAGALGELVRSFETAKNAWSRAVTEAEREVSGLASRVESARQQRLAVEDELREAGLEELPASLSRWADAMRAVLPSWRESDSMQRPEGLVSSGLRELGDIGLALRERAESIEEALAGVDVAAAEVLPAVPEVTAADIASWTLRVNSARQTLSNAREAVGAAQRTLEAVRVSREELAAMADLALRHLSEECPTCGQPVNPGALRARLEAMLQTGSHGVEAQNLRLALQAQERSEHEVAEADAALRRLVAQREDFVRQQAAQDAFQARRQERERSLAALLGVEGAVSRPNEEWRLEASRVLGQVAATRQAAAALTEEGRLLQSRLRASTGINRLEALDAQIGSALAEYQTANSDLESRRATNSAADSLLKALRRDSETFLNERLADIQPLLDHLYAAIDPHPTFRSVQLVTRNWYGKNRLDAIARDDETNISMRDPGRALSTSQANALAVTIFLAFNLGLSPTALQTIVLDDPLQNLDDVHLLGLVDLLRRIVPYRQLIITTHDQSFARLLARKLRPLERGTRVCLLSIAKWDREGPQLESEDIEADLRPMKLATA